jgi:hypothetical protein
MCKYPPSTLLLGPRRRKGSRDETPRGATKRFATRGARFAPAAVRSTDRFAADRALA